MHDLFELAVYIATDSERAAEYVEGAFTKRPNCFPGFRAVGAMGVFLEPANGLLIEPLIFLRIELFPGGFAYSASITAREDGPGIFDSKQI